MLELTHRLRELDERGFVAGINRSERSVANVR